MDGVTVLNVVEKTRLPDWATIGIVLCLFAMVAFFAGLSNAKTIKKIDIVLYIMKILIILVLQMRKL